MTWHLLTSVFAKTRNQSQANEGSKAVLAEAKLRHVASEDKFRVIFVEVKCITTAETRVRYTW